MRKQRKWAVCGMLAASLFVAAIGSTTVAPTAQAAEAVPEKIRIAMYIHSGKFTTTVETAGFSADKGMVVGLRAADGVHNWLSVPANTLFRAGLDHYRIKLLETADYNQAKAAFAAAGAKNSPAIYKLIQQNTAIYQVIIGGYANKGVADQALLGLKTTAGLSGYALNASITGPYHLSAGSYSSEKQARAEADTFRLSGLPVDLAIQEDATGVLSYSLWIGEAEDLGALLTLQQDLEARIPGVVLSVVEPGTPYLLEKEDVGATTSGTGGTLQYLFNASGQKVWITAPGGKITLAEKKLSYNGSFELSQLNGKMAVVNELPFEQYLYSVVHAELGPGYPKEALKAQAVAARTYSVKAGLKYEIANMTDTTLDQVYFGKESDDVTVAVKETKGEVLMLGNKLIDTYFYSNAGGQTAEGSEVWGNPVSYLQSVSSPDTYPTIGKLPWYRIMKQDGTSGYVRSDLLLATGAKSAVGIPIYRAAEVANVRRNPLATDSSSPIIGQLTSGEQVYVIGKTEESTSYSWTRFFTAEQLLPKVNAYHPLGFLHSLEVAKRGVSGRVTGLKVNGSEFTLKSPDSFRTMLNGLPSTLFDIEETGRYTILSATGTRAEYPQETGTLYAVTASGNKVQTSNEFLIMNGQGQVRLATQDPQFLITGKGYGHGLGMSQNGAVGFAREGKDYKYILTHYYSGTTIVKQ